MFANDSLLASPFFSPSPLCYLATLNEELKAAVMMKRERFPLKYQSLKPTQTQFEKTLDGLVGAKETHSNLY